MIRYSTTLKCGHIFYYLLVSRLMDGLTGGQVPHPLAEVPIKAGAKPRTDWPNTELDGAWVILSKNWDTNALNIMREYRYKYSVGLSCIFMWKLYRHSYQIRNKNHSYQIRNKNLIILALTVQSKFWPVWPLRIALQPNPNKFPSCPSMNI